MGYGNHGLLLLAVVLVWDLWCVPLPLPCSKFPQFPQFFPHASPGIYTTLLNTWMENYWTDLYNFIQFLLQAHDLLNTHTRSLSRDESYKGSCIEVVNCRHTYWEGSIGYNNGILIALNTSVSQHLYTFEIEA